MLIICVFSIFSMTINNIMKYFKIIFSFKTSYAFFYSLKFTILLKKCFKM